jgi:hypothetical protein
MFQTGGKTVAAVVLLFAVLTAACGVGDYQFRNDHRLSFESPRERQNVALPLTVRWSMKDFAPGQDGTFAVFVDRAPMPVGKDLKWLVRNLDNCADDPKCPTADQLAREDVYVTTRTVVKLQQLPRVGGSVGKEQHYVNVVLLDATGTRQTESAWYLPFTTDRRKL